MGDEAVSTWRKVLGPTDSGVAQKDAAHSLRAQFGTDGTKNAGHGSDSLASAARVTKKQLSKAINQAYKSFLNILIKSKEMIGCVFNYTYFCLLGAGVLFPLHCWSRSLQHSQVLRLHLLYHQTTCHLRG